MQNNIYNKYIKTVRLNLHYSLQILNLILVVCLNIVEQRFLSVNAVIKSSIKLASDSDSFCGNTLIGGTLKNAAQHVHTLGTARNRDVTPR